MVAFMVTGCHKRLLDNGTWVVLSSGESTGERWNGAYLKEQWKLNLAWIWNRQAPAAPKVHFGP